MTRKENDISETMVASCRFASLTASSVYLHYRISNYKGPDADNHFFFGYREEKFLASYVNFFAALAYVSIRCLSNASVLQSALVQHS